MAEKTVAHHENAPERQESTRERETTIRPPVDIYESPEGLTVVADLPGVTREALNIEVKTVNGVVELGGTAKSKAEADKAVSLARSVQGVKSVQNNIRM